ncbi:MAG: FAD-dependent oxidoreductase [Nocardioidaceae bacterium]|nr:MAG: FAD-dependent oxidoreductase [Nocardioidaceae bacterium]
MPRPALPGDLTLDVAIVGAGYTGLWTAYYLLAADPSLDVGVIEAERVGFGASGRNGGWCSALFPTPLPGMHEAMAATVDEVGAICANEEIDAHFHKGGTIVLARSPAQLMRMEPEPGGVVLDEQQARARLNATGMLGATFTPDCARIHPLRLARGLADVVERRGGVIYEGTRVRAISSGSPGMVETDRGTVRAGTVIRATEGYTHSLRGDERTLAPVYSLIVATEPLPASTWNKIGLDDYETFSDHRHLIIYGQRTSDDRLVFGGRGAPYHFRSSTKPGNDNNPRVFAKLGSEARAMFPALRSATFTHAWGGALGVPRDWCASVGLSDGIGWAGGYVGDGVGTTNLAGRTLRDLILGRQTELTALPWVGHDSGLWEPEPLRYLEINAALRAMTLADFEENRTGRPSKIASFMSRFLGG